MVFKIESHNHPSAVDPYQGAATGVGGIVRDIFTMGARPVALVNSLRLGPLSSKHNRHLFKGIVAGVAGYGKGLGLPVIAGEVGFDNCYDSNPLVNAMAVGVLPVEQLVRGIASEAGKLVALAGAPTGRDGVHGATFASEELAPQAETAVHIGDPSAGRLLMEACLELARQKLVLGMQDLGAAGLTCAATEMAARGGTGMEISLDRVPLKAENMADFEIAISESQERMLLVLDPEHEGEAARVFRDRGLHFDVVGRVTEDGVVRIRQKGRVVAQVPAVAVAGGAPEYSPTPVEPEYYRQLAKFDPELLPLEADLNRVLVRVLGSPDGAGKEWIWKQFENPKDDRIVMGPGEEAGIIRLAETGQGIAVAVDGNSRMTYLDPYRGGCWPLPSPREIWPVWGPDPWELPTASILAIRNARRSTGNLKGPSRGWPRPAVPCRCRWWGAMSVFTMRSPERLFSPPRSWGRWGCWMIRIPFAELHLILVQI